MVSPPGFAVPFPRLVEIFIMASSQPNEQPGLFSTAAGLVVLAAMFLILACGLSLVAVIVLDRVTVDDPILRDVLAYALFAIPTLLIGAALVTGGIGTIRWAIYGKDATSARSGHQEEFSEVLAQISDRLMVSETAKRIAYREHDIEVLRKTIQKDLKEHDYEAAMVLVHELAQTFGRREEAEQFRAIIEEARTKELNAKVQVAMDALDRTLADHDFDTAAAEAARIERLFPESERARDVRRRVDSARSQYKHDLERQFLEAAQRDDVDRAMELLKEMDHYLTEEEAQPLREVARGVIGKKRDNLGVQFKLAIHDREWTEATRIGQQIIREFPNSRMADEVRGMLDTLRERAAHQHAAEGAR